MPSVEDQPIVTLVRWRVLRIKSKKISIDLVLGWCLEDGHARMSTPIVDHNSSARTLTTRSGRVYVVEGDPDYCDDAQYIAEEHFGRAAEKAKDVSAEYFKDLIQVDQAILNVPDHNVALDSDVSLSGAQSSNFVADMDKLFQPNPKLAKALKRQRNPKKSSAAIKKLNTELNEVHIAYFIYFATGEGVSIFVAVGTSYVKAERLFKSSVPEYFHAGMKVQPLDSEEVKMAQVLDLLPQAILNLFSDNAPGSTEYFSRVHYNLFC